VAESGVARLIQPAIGTSAVRVGVRESGSGVVIFPGSGTSQIRVSVAALGMLSELGYAGSATRPATAGFGTVIFPISATAGSKALVRVSGFGTSSILGPAASKVLVRVSASGTVAVGSVGTAGSKALVRVSGSGAATLLFHATGASKILVRASASGTASSAGTAGSKVRIATSAIATNIPAGGSRVRVASSGSSTLITGLRQRGNIDYDQIRAIARQGTGAMFQMFAGGQPVAGNAAVFDAQGNIKDSGVVPGGGGGGQTPWVSNIDGGGHALSNVNIVAINAGLTGSFGTSAPLSVLGNGSSPYGNAYFQRTDIASSNLSHFQFGATGDWYIRSAANTGMVLLQDTGGNVGIGTTSPAYKLDLAGDARMSGNVLLPGLPSTAPAAGSKQLYYDPADGNRVKFVP